jgi:hypothetical protein
MELLSQLTIPRPEGDASIQLLYGDLSAIPPGLAVDILAVSAFRGNYSPVHDTLIGALDRAGLSVADLALHKDVDLLNQLSCWLSKPLSPAQQARFNVKKILCFEPARTATDAETEVQNLFRGINTFAIDDDHNDIAMPVLATGNQQFPLEIMLPLLLDTAIFWLENGLPLTSLKFALFRPDQLEKGRPIFENAKKQYELKARAEAGQISASQSLSEITLMNKAASVECPLPKLAYALQEKAQAELDDSLELFDGDIDTRGDIFAPPPPVSEYDYFISYSHRYMAPVQEFVKALQAHNPQLRIFYDRDSIPTGGLWIKMISDAIQNSKNVVCILTPEYSQSPVCWDEFQCAKAKEYRTKQPVIKTINFCNDVNLPLMLSIYSYIDCTEADLDKLKNAVAQVVS